MAEVMHPVMEKYFPALVQEEYAFLNQLLEIRNLPKGDALFVTGSEADSLFFILEGRFAVHKEIGIGERTQVVALLDAGTIAGEAAVATDRMHGATVTAVERSTVAGLSRQALTDLEEHMPQLFIGLLKKTLSITSLRLQKSSERLALVL